MYQGQLFSGQMPKDFNHPVSKRAGTGIT